jgi:hypothetical protein
MALKVGQKCGHTQVQNVEHGTTITPKDGHRVCVFHVTTFPLETLARTQ